MVRCSSIVEAYSQFKQFDVRLSQDKGVTDVGVRIVPISQIRGSEGRTGDFDRYFNPLQRHTEGRWLNIALARLNDVSLPPVKLIQLGEYYFVQDGHHRLSVARAFGQTDIDAEVTLWLVSRARTMRSRTASSIYQPI